MNAPPEVLQQITAKQQALLAQCPPALARVDTGDVFVEHVGATGPRVVIVHGGLQGGIGGGPATFAQQRILGTEGWRLELVERPGFGRSPSRGVDDMVADMPWLIARLGDGPVHLLGHSWGGALALLAAAERPKAVRSLVLVEPALHALAATEPDADRSAIASSLAPLFAADTPADYARGFIRGQGVPGDATTNGILARLDDATAARLGAAFLQSRPAAPPVLRKAADTVRAAGIPVLLVTGGWSPAFDATAAAVARMLNGTHTVVRSPNHFPQRENAAAFNAAVTAFWKGQ